MPNATTHDTLSGTYQQGAAAMSDDSTNDKWISTADAAEIMKVSQATVARLCREGKIKCEQVARNWLVSKKAANDYVKRIGRPPISDD